MTRVFSAEWGDHQAQVSTVGELDAVLAQVEADRSADGLPYKVDLFLEDGSIEQGNSGLQLGLGYPERAFLMWFGEPAGGLGYEPGLPAWQGKVLSFDYGGVPTEDGPERLRVRPEVAREAAREYVRTGVRPRCVEWEG